MSSEAPRLRLSTCGSHRGYRAYCRKTADEQVYRRRHETGLLDGDRPVNVSAWCHCCRSPSSFAVDFRYADPGLKDGEQPLPNWRERMECRRCGLNSRIRAAAQFFEDRMAPDPEDDIYLTEQLTPFYRYLRTRFERVTGSEYLGQSLPYGSENVETGVRNESLAQLSFGDAAFDYILSFDVFEHIPDYRQAFAECLRCLKPGGVLLFSVPFLVHSAENRVRARLGEDGRTEHLLPPEYHGDPLREAGCLCYYHFGWALLDELRGLGFRDVAANFIWSDELACLGDNQLLFTARRRRSFSSFFSRKRNGAPRRPRRPASPPAP
jgi:SAM-dependent methyltransferase